MCVCVCVSVCVSGCGMKLGAVEGSHTAERADRGQHGLPHTHPKRTEPEGGRRRS